MALLTSPPFDRPGCMVPYSHSPTATGVASSAGFLRLSFLLNTAYAISLGLLDRVSMPSGFCWTWLMAAFLVTVVKPSYTFSSSPKQFLRIAVGAGINLTSLHSTLSRGGMFLSFCGFFAFTVVIMGIYCGLTARFAVTGVFLMGWNGRWKTFFNVPD
jgi:hypothetical protein